jgi:hypothetical protein
MITMIIIIVIIHIPGLFNQNKHFWLIKTRCKSVAICHVVPPCDCLIDDSPYYVFVALCIVVIVISLIKIAASNENIECFREYFGVGYNAPDPSFFKSSCMGQDKK